MEQASEWAMEQWGTVDLGDKRLNRRAVAVGAGMAGRTDASMTRQMKSWGELKGAYGLLNNKRVSLEKLTAPHRAATLKRASAEAVTLLIEDSTELDYSTHKQKKGLGPIGNGHGQGLILHSTLAVNPDTREVLGLAHVQAILRQPTPKPRPRGYQSDEGLVWETSVKAIGAPPEGVMWVHVSDRGSDIFEYMRACVDQRKDFVVRAKYNRIVTDADMTSDEISHVFDYIRAQPAVPDSAYTVKVSARPGQPARMAQVVLAWAKVDLAVPAHLSADTQAKGPLSIYIVRAFEPNPVEWVLLTTRPVLTLAQAQQIVSWYECRWLCEEYHMCLKTGCKIEASQLDNAVDIQRLLGLATPIAVRLLQLKHMVHQTPDRLASDVLDPLMVQVLALRYKAIAATLTLAEFWKRVARLGGHIGRSSDGDPGWRTLWKGWQLLSDLTDGARLLVQTLPNKRSG
jgi:hypothetical protein